jgi:hypothetical protein
MDVSDKTLPFFFNLENWGSRIYPNFGIVPEDSEIILCISTYGLFNNVLNNQDCIPSNVRMNSDQWFDQNVEDGSRGLIWKFIRSPVCSKCEKYEKPKSGESMVE